jgi:hypothetical protein
MKPVSYNIEINIQKFKHWGDMMDKVKETYSSKLEKHVFQISCNEVEMTWAQLKDNINIDLREKYNKNHVRNI